MSDAHDVDVGDYLAGLTELVLRASPGPFLINQPTGRGHTVTAVNGRHPLATFTHRGDAELFTRAPADLRAAAAALVETLGLHRDAGGGLCAQDSQQMSCLTRRVLIAQLAPRAAAS